MKGTVGLAGERRRMQHQVVGRPLQRPIDARQHLPDGCGERFQRYCRQFLRTAARASRGISQVSNGTRDAKGAIARIASWSQIMPTSIRELVRDHVAENAAAGGFEMA